MNDQLRKRMRTILSLVLVVLYLIGLVVMITGSFQAGVYLWMISTLGGIGLLYWIRTQERKKAEAEQISKGMPYGEPDDPTTPLTPFVPPEEAEGQDSHRV